MKNGLNKIDTRITAWLKTISESQDDDIRRIAFSNGIGYFEAAEILYMRQNAGRVFLPKSQEQLTDIKKMKTLREWIL